MLKNYYLFIILILFLELDLSKGQSHLWVYNYPAGTKNCQGTPTLVSSFTLGQCYEATFGSFKYFVSGSNFYNVFYGKAGCTGDSTNGPQNAGGACMADVYKSIIQTTYVTPSEGYIYYERYSSAGVCSATNPIKAVLRPGVCSYSDSIAGFTKGTMGSLTGATIGHSYEGTIGECQNLQNTAYSFSTCTNTIQRIYRAFSATSLAITFSAVKINSPTSVTFTVTINWPIPVTVNVQYQNGAAFAGTSCNNLATGKSCTINGIPDGITTKLRGILSSGGQPFGGKNSGDSAAIVMPIADTMKTVSVSARTTKSLTVTYSSNKGVSGRTTFVVKSNGVAVSGCGFSSCVISGLAAGTSYTIAVNALNAGYSSNVLTTTGTTYTQVTVPTISLKDNPTSIVATFSSTGGVPSPATTYQLLVNNVVQASCTASPCTIGGLTTLSTYSVFVRAINDGVTKTSSTQSIKLWDLIKVPSLTSTMYTNRAVLSFSAAGGEPALTRYSISVNNGAVSTCQSITATTCTVTGLSPSTSYTFVVTGSNDGTTQTKSLTSSTYGVITAPALSASTITTKAITLSFPSSQGVPSGTTYTVTSNNVNVAGCVAITATTCQLTGLAAATAYAIKVTATNDGTTLSSSNTYTTLQQVTTPAVSITLSKLQLTVAYSTQYGYSTSTYDVLVNGAVVCAATTALQCTFNNVVLGNKYDVQVKVTNDGVTKTGTGSFQTFADTMKTLQVISYTTRSITFGYSSTYGAQGVTTFAFTINGSPVTCTGFSQCTVSSFTPASPAPQLTIVGKSINYGNESPTMTISQQLYPVVSKPTYSMSNTPTSISLSFSSTGGVPSGTVHQVLLNDTIQTCPTSPCTISNLVTLSTYAVQVKAINDLTTTLSDIKVVKLWDIMTTPTLSATVLTKTATLTFSATGGDPSLTRYSISVNGAPYTACQSITATKCDITSLTPAKSYTFAVSSTNAGTTLSKSLTASTFAEISGGTVASTSITTKLISVTFGVTGGVTGSTRYTVTYNGVNAPGCVDISTTSCLISGLSQSTAYMVEVTAINDGKSLVFSKSFTTVTKISKPLLTIIGKPTSIFARYPTTNGVLSPATTYQVFLNGAVQSVCSPTATTCTISGLTTLSNYTVQVKATNDDFTTESDIQEITLWDHMTEPILTTGDILTKHIEIFYEAPGGNPLDTSFEVKMNGDIINTVGGPCTESKPDSSGVCRLSNLTPNVNYKFIVIATNLDRILNSTLDVQTFAELSNLQVQIDSITTSKISLSYSTDNGVPDSTFYNVSLNGSPISQCFNIQSTSCQIDSLPAGSSQQIEITAHNDEKTLTFSEQRNTFKEITAPTVQISQTSAKSFEIDFSSDFGVEDPITTYDVLVNQTVVCGNTTELTCSFDQLVLGSLYEIEVIAYNDEISKRTVDYHQTYEKPTSIDIVATVSSSSISLKWNASEYGVPNSTYYTTVLSYNSQNWVEVCPTSKQLSCEILNVASETNYVVKVTVSNTYFDRVDSYQTVSTLPTSIGSGNHPCRLNETSPICSSNGICDVNDCKCNEGWSGILCQIKNDNQNNGNDTITPNPDKPQIDIDNNGINYKFELLELIEINEISDSIKSLNLSQYKWNLDSSSNSSVQHPMTGEELTHNEWNYFANLSSVNGFTESIKITFIQYRNPVNTTLTATTYPVAFAGKQFPINIGSYKFTMSIDRWPFESKLNSLVLSTKITNPVGYRDECNRLLKPKNDTLVSSPSDASGVTTFNIGDGYGNYIVGNLLNTIIVDTIPMTVQHNHVQKDGFVLIHTVIPYFEIQAIVDPDFGLILSPKNDDQNSGDLCRTKAKNDNWRVIVGAVVGGTAGVALVAATAMLFKKRATAKRYNKRVEAAAQKSVENVQ